MFTAGVPEQFSRNNKPFPGTFYLIIIVLCNTRFQVVFFLNLHLIFQLPLLGGFVTIIFDYFLPKYTTRPFSCIMIVMT